MVNEWREVRLGEIAEIIMGQSPPGETYNHSGEGLPFFQGVADFGYRHPTPRVYCTAPSRIAYPGDILLSVRAPIGRVNVVDKECSIGRGLSIVRPRHSADARYIEFVLRYLEPQWHKIEGGGSVFGNATRDDLERLHIPWFESESDRCAIAHILGTLDDKIELNRLMSQTLEQMARALFKAWFVDFEPVRAKMEGRWKRGQSLPGLPAHLYDLFPNRLVDSELGEIPEGWRIVEIGDIAHVIDCLHSKKPERKEAGLPLLQLWNIRDDGLIDMTDTYYIDEADYEKWITRMEASPGDCVITNVGRVGAVAQIPDGLKAALGRNMTGIRCKSSFPFPTFIIECLRSEAMRNEITLKMDTGTILEALNVRNIPKLRLVLPHLELLRVFEQSVKPLRARMELNLLESHTLATLRDTLLPKLISSELRVKDAERFLKERGL